MLQRRNHGRFRAARPSISRRPRIYKVKCSGCGKEIIMPVPPPEDKELVCLECFGKTRASSREESHE